MLAIENITNRSIGNCTSIFQQDYTACKTCDFSSLAYHCKIFLDYLSIGDGNPHWALRSWCGISSINSASRIVPNPSWELVFTFQPFKKIQKAGQNRPDLPVSTRWRQNWEGASRTWGKCCHVALKQRSERQTILSNRSWFLNGDFRGKIVADTDAAERISRLSDLVCDDMAC